MVWFRKERPLRDNVDSALSSDTPSRVCRAVVDARAAGRGSGFLADLIFASMLQHVK